MSGGRNKGKSMRHDYSDREDLDLILAFLCFPVRLARDNGKNGEKG